MGDFHNIDFDYWLMQNYQLMQLLRKGCKSCPYEKDRSMCHKLSCEVDYMISSLIEDNCTLKLIRDYPVVTYPSISK